MIRNGYITLDEFKDYGISRASNDIDDDAVIEKIINAVSRYIDDKAARTFYPRVETRYYSVTDDPQLDLDDDLLAVITLTNGDTTVITSTYYNLLPRNAYPKYAIRLKANSGYYWEVDSNAEGEYVISVDGIWGYHEHYATYAWKSLTTINEGAPLAAADTAITLTSVAGLNVEGGQILKIENELIHVRSVSGLIATVERGGNGSTAAIHADGTAVTLWTPITDIVEACAEIVNSIYKRRTGENVYASTVLTAGGVMVTPRDVPDFARDIIQRYTRLI